MYDARNIVTRYNLSDYKKHGCILTHGEYTLPNIPDVGQKKTDNFISYDLKPNRPRNAKFPVREEDT